MSVDAPRDPPPPNEDDGTLPLRWAFIGTIGVGVGVLTGSATGPAEGTAGGIFAGLAAAVALHTIIRRR